jgi:dolichyl-phosphate-mannose-protein mannosyltransferase
LPFIFIGRVMFLYHYEAALIFAIIAIAFLFDLIKNEKYRKITILVVVVLSLAAFIYFSPLTYGLELNMNKLTDRMWLSSWR